MIKRRMYNEDEYNTDENNTVMEKRKLYSIIIYICTYTYKMKTKKSPYIVYSRCIYMKVMNYIC